MQNKNEEIMIGANLRFSGCLYNYFIQNCIFMNCRINLTVLYQFLETGTSDRCFICIVQRLRFLMFHLIPPFIFSLQSLYKETKLYIFSLQKIKWQKLCKRLTNTEYQFFIVKVFYVFFGKRKFLCCKTECHASLTK